MKKRNNVKKESMTSAIGIGTLASVVTGVLASMLLAMLVIKGTTAESAVQYVCYGILFLSAFTGSLLSGKRATGKYGVACLCASLVFLLILIGCNIIFFDGTFQNLLTKMLAILLGCGLACVLVIKGTGSRKKKRYNR